MVIEEGFAFRPGSFLARLSPEDLSVLFAAGQRRRYVRNANLFLEGESPGRVFMSLRGRAKVSSASPRGRAVVLGIRGSGDILGELSAIDGRPRIASAVALEPTEMLLVPAAAFQSFVEGRPGVASALLRVFAERLRESDTNRTHFGSDDCATRVALLLLDLSQRHGALGENGNKIDLPLTQQDIADWVGESREAVTKALHSLRAAGLVETDRRAITILDAPGLAVRAS